MILPKLTSLLESINSYLSIGHGPDNYDRDGWNEDSWVIINDNLLTAKQLYKKGGKFKQYADSTESKTFKYDGHIDDSLHEWAELVNGVQATGRIDHNKKMISASAQDRIPKDYIKRLMSIDYPDYVVKFFSGPFV